MARYPMSLSLAQIAARGNEGRPAVAILLGLAFVISILTSCGNGSHLENASPNPTPVALKLTVDPASASVAPRSTTTFTASPGAPPGFVLVWSVSPISGGTITSSGIYTAPEKPGNYSVIATWVPTNSSTGNNISSSSAVTVLSPIAPNTDLAQASGALQISGPIQNAVIIGGAVPAVKSIDPTGKTQVQSGFPVPLPCKASDPSCH